MLPFRPSGNSIYCSLIVNNISQKSFEFGCITHITFPHNDSVVIIHLVTRNIFSNSLVKVVFGCLLTMVFLWLHWVVKTFLQMVLCVTSHYWCSSSLVWQTTKNYYVVFLHCSVGNGEFRILQTNIHMSPWNVSNKVNNCAKSTSVGLTISALGSKVAGC